MSLSEATKKLVQDFQVALGSKYDELKGNWKEEKFDVVLSKFNIKKDDYDKEELRIALKKEGFFEGVSTGNIFKYYKRHNSFLFLLLRNSYRSWKNFRAVVSTYFWAILRNTQHRNFLRKSRRARNEQTNHFMLVLICLIIFDVRLFVLMERNSLRYFIIFSKSTFCV